MTAPRPLFLLLLACAVFPSMAQERTQSPPAATAPHTAPAPHLPAPGPLVQPDGAIVFRFPAPNAKAVLLHLEGTADPLPMTRGADGVWTVTTQPLAPEYYSYFFLVDGVPAFDPGNVSIKTSLIEDSNVVLVPGKTPMPWEVADVPHGVIHQHFYRSAIVQTESNYYVYTPPGFDAKQKYPVLYLLHGYSDDASAWTAMGKANVILDNLIAAGRVKPMIVVMPLGYGTMEVITRGHGVWQDRSIIDRNYDQFAEVLLREVKPQVESVYPISPAREDHAIAGLSMGGGESLRIGLNHLEDFAWVGAFSAAVQDTDFAAVFPGMNAGVNSRLRLLWIACGRQDHLFAPNQKFIAWLQQQGVQVTPVATPGMHEWPVWRENLVSFAPLLFQPKP